MHILISEPGNASHIFVQRPETLENENEIGMRKKGFVIGKCCKHIERYFTLVKYRRRVKGP